MNKMEQCPKVPITDLLECIVDNRGKSCPTSETGFPLIATNCIKHTSIYPTFENIRYISDDTRKNWFRAELKPNDILFVNKGTPGRVCLVPDPVTFCAAQDMIGLRVNKDKVYYRYLFAVLRSSFIQEKIANFHVGIAIPHFKKSDLDNLLIPIPDEEIQRKIGDFYFDLSAIIENNNKIVEESVQFGKMLYNYWFLQFDFPDKNGNPYKSSGGKMIWNDLIKAEIPEGWSVSTVGKAAKFENGDRGKNYPSGSDFVSEGIPFINGGMIVNNSISEDVQYITEEKYDTLRAGKAKKDDILLTLRGAIDKCVYSPFERAAIASALVIVRPLAIINNTYLYHYLISDYYRQLCSNYDNGSVQANLSVDIVKTFPIVIPPRDVLEHWEKVMKNVDNMIGHKKEETAELNSTRDYIMPLLLSGQTGF
jgi:type I restriction enzyme S subunit